MARVPPPPRSQGARAYAAWHREHGSNRDAVELSRRLATAALGAAIGKLNASERMNAARRAQVFGELQAALSHLGLSSLSIDENAMTLGRQVESHIVDEIFVEVD